MGEYNPDACTVISVKTGPGLQIQYTIDECPVYARPLYARSTECK